MNNTLEAIELPLEIVVLKRCQNQFLMYGSNHFAKAMDKSKSADDRLGAFSKYLVNEEMAKMCMDTIEKIEAR